MWKRFAIGLVALVFVLGGTATAASAQSPRTALVAGSGTSVSGTFGFGWDLSGTLLGVPPLIHGTYSLSIFCWRSDLGECDGTLSVNDNSGSTSYCTGVTNDDINLGYVELDFTTLAGSNGLCEGAASFSGHIIIVDASPLVTEVLVSAGSLSFSQ